MAEPHIEILGVYEPVIPEETYAEQLAEYGNIEETDSYFRQLALIEALVHNPDDRFNLGEIGQQPPWSNDPRSMLVPYDEGLLSSDGEALIQREMDCVHGTGTLRFAFYLQFYDPDRPLNTPYGPINCPPKRPAPIRLMSLMPYAVQT